MSFARPPRLVMGSYDTLPSSADRGAGGSYGIHRHRRSAAAARSPTRAKRRSGRAIDLRAPAPAYGFAHSNEAALSASPLV
jgi:hypothetical protein